MRFFTLFCSTLLLFTIVSKAAEPPKFSHFTTENGLPANMIQALYQDSYGFVWIGTNEGISRFDSHKFKNYLTPASIAANGTNKLVRAIHQYKKNNTLWIGTQQGVYIYNYDGDSVERCEIPQIGSNSVNAIKTDDKDNIWIALNRNGIVKYNPITYSIKEYKANGGKGDIGSNNIIDIIVDNEFKVWLLTMGGSVYTYESESDTFEKIVISANGMQSVESFSAGCLSDDGTILLGAWSGGLFRVSKNGIINHYALPNDNGGNIERIHSVAEVAGKFIMVGSDEGLTLVDSKTGFTQTIKNDPANSRSLSDRFVYPILKDDDDGIWVGTYFGGVNYFSPNEVFFKLYFGGANFKGRVISRFCQDINDNIWIGTDDAGLLMMDSKSGRITNITVWPNNEPLNIHALCADNENIWVGTYQKGLYKYNSISKKSFKIDNIDNVYALERDKNGKIWAGTIDALYTIEKGSNVVKRVEPSLHGLEQIQQDPRSNLIWIASTSRGVSYFDPKIRKFSHLDAELTAHGVTPNRVRTIAIGDSGIWIGVANMGILFYDSQKKRIQNEVILERELTRLNVHFIAQEGRKLWITTSDGLYMYDTENGNHIMFNRQDGLQGNQFNPNAGLVSKDKKIYIGGTNGFNSFDAANMPFKPHKHPLVFTNFLIYNKEATIGKGDLLEKHINLSRHVTLDYTQRIFSIEFASLNYESATKSRYRYRLLGFDKNFVETEQGVHSATYTNIPSGEYTFELLSTNSVGEWIETPESVRLTILPPWWSSILMKLLYVILILITIAGAFFVLLRRANRRNKEKIRRLKDENNQKIIQAKVDFFTHIAHEIRTPAALIAAPIEDIFKNCTHDGQLTENLEVIRNNSNRLVNLVNQILDFRRSEEPSFEIVSSRANLLTLVKNIVAQFKPEAKNRDIKLKLNCDETQNYDLCVDPESLTKIVTNLITNALKFTADQIIIEIEQIDDYNLKLTVTDNGAGIEQNKIKEVFTPFYTTDYKSNRPFKGFGIGLSLVATLAQKMGITINVNSVIGQGSTFELTIPRGKLKESEQYPATIVSHVEQNSKKHFEPTKKEGAQRILIVEDNSDFAFYINKTINKDFDTLIAENGQVALDILDSQHVDLIISDVAMDVMDGFEMCQKIKSDLKLSHIPIIMLTAQTDCNSKIQGLDNGADVYLEKPISMDYLYAQMVSLLEKRKMLQAHFSKTPTAPLSSITQSRTDLEFLNRVNEVIEENIANTEFSVDQIAKTVGMSRSSLYVKLKEVSDLSPNEFIRIVRLRKACQYILERDYRINEISYLVGFNNPSYFSRCFFDQYGVLPKDYLATIIESNS